MSMFSKWWSNKTSKLGVAAVLTGTALIISGDTTNGIQTVIGGLGLIFLRQAITKS